jgi:hypothetical protein
MPSSRLPSRSTASALRVAVLVAALATVIPAGARAQVLAQAVPSQYDLQLEPGRRESRPIFLHNPGRESVKVRMRIADLRMSERGALDLLPPGTLESTLSKLVEFEPRELVLGPGEHRTVRMQITLPVDGPPTRYGVALSSVTPAQPGDAAGVASAPAELGTTLYLTRAPRSSIHTELIALDARAGAGRVTVGVRVRNRSERYASCTGEVKLADAAGTKVIAGRMSDGIVLPGAVRVFEWEGAKSLAAGRYLVTVTIDAGEPELLVGQKEIVVARPGPNAARSE